MITSISPQPFKIVKAFDWRTSGYNPQTGKETIAYALIDATGQLIGNGQFDVDDSEARAANYEDSFYISKIAQHTGLDLNPVNDGFMMPQNLVAQK